MIDDRDEEYEVQIYLNQKWATHRTFPVHMRSDAIREADRLDESRPDLPIRVLFHSFNKMNEIFTQAIIHRNKVRENQLLAAHIEERVKDARTPLRTLEYMGGLLYLMFISMIIGGLAVLGLELLIIGFQTQVGDDLRLNLLGGMFVLVFMISFVSAYQYFRAKYYYRFPVRRRKIAQKKQMTRKEQQRAYDHALIQQSMKMAASEIAQMPIMSHQRDEEDVFEKYHMPMTANSEDETTLDDSIILPVGKAKLILHTFFNDSLQVMISTGISLTDRTRPGLNILMMSALRYLLDTYDFKRGDATDLRDSILDVLKIAAGKRARFVKEFNGYDRHPKHGPFIKRVLDFMGSYTDQSLANRKDTPFEMNQIAEAFLDWEDSLFEKPPVYLHIFLSPNPERGEHGFGTVLAKNFELYQEDFEQVPYPRIKLPHLSEALKTSYEVQQLWGAFLETEQGKGQPAPFMMMTPESRQQSRPAGAEANETALTALASALLDQLNPNESLIEGMMWVARELVYHEEPTGLYKIEWGPTQRPENQTGLQPPSGDEDLRKTG